MFGTNLVSNMVVLGTEERLKTWEKYGWVGAICTLIAGLGGALMMIGHERGSQKPTEVIIKDISAIATVSIVSATPNPTTGLPLDITTRVFTTTVYLTSTTSLAPSVTHTITALPNSTDTSTTTIIYTPPQHAPVAAKPPTTIHSTTITETSTAHDTTTVTEASTAHDTTTVTEVSTAHDTTTVTEVSTAHDSITVTETSTAHGTITMRETYIAHDTITVTHSPHSDAGPTKTITVTPECEATDAEWIKRELEAQGRVVAACDVRISQMIHLGRDDPSVAAMRRQCQAHHKEFCYLSKRLNINWASCADNR